MVTLTGWVGMVCVLLAVVTACAVRIIRAWSDRPEEIGDALKHMGDTITGISEALSARIRTLELEAETVKDQVKRAISRNVQRDKREARSEEPELSDERRKLMESLGPPDKPDNGEEEVAGATAPTPGKSDLWSRVRRMGRGGA